MLRVAIRYMGRDKDDTFTTTINEDVCAKFRSDLVDAKSGDFVTLETVEKTIMLRRENIIAVTFAAENRDR